MKKRFRFMLPLLILCLMIATPVCAASKKTQKITVKYTEYSKVYGDKPFCLGAKAKTALSYSSSNTKVATVDKKGKVTLKNGGDAVITIKAAATKEYKAATKKVSLYVRAKDSRKSVASIVLKDGSKIKAGSGIRIPASRLAGAKIKFEGLDSKAVWRTAWFSYHGEYWVSEDPGAAWGGTELYYTASGKKQAEKLAKQNGWDLKEQTAVMTIDARAAKSFQSAGYWEEEKWIDMPKWEKPTHLYVAIAPVQIDGVTGRYRYENNFEIDLER